MRIGIIGGGITGLAVAYYLSRQGHHVEIFEKQDYLGGLAAGIKVGDTYVERYYHHIFRYESSIQDFCRELGINNLIKWHTSHVGLFYNGKSYAFGTPTDLLSLPFLSLFDKLRLGLFTLYAPRIRDWRKLEGIPAEAWLKRYLGKKTYDIIWKPLLVNKFGPRHYKEVPASYVWERLGKRTTSKHSIFEKENLGYIEGSFQSLIDRAASEIGKRGGRFHLGTGVKRLVIKSGEVKGIIAGKKEYQFDIVINTLALPLFLDIAPGLPAGYRQSLASIKYAGVINLLLFMKKPVSGFYWTNIHSEGFPFSLVVEHTNFISPSRYGTHIMYISHYMPTTEEGFFERKPIEVYREWVSSLKKMYPQLDEKDITSFSLTFSRHANPMISLNFSRKMPPFETPIRGLYLVERSQLPLLQQGTDNCIILARQFMAYLKKKWINGIR